MIPDTNHLQPHLDAAIAVIRQFAEANGRPPKRKEYQLLKIGRARGPEWFRNEHGILYDDIVRMAGYETKGDAVAETNRYIDNARERQIRRNPWAQEWPLEAVASSARQEVREVRQRDGTVLRITRTKVSLR